MGKHHAGGTLRRATTPRSVALLIVGVVGSSSSTIDIQVYGNPPPDGPCTANGYVVSGFISPRVSIGSRTITH